MYSPLFDVSSPRSLRALRGRQIPLDAAIYQAVREGHRRIMVQLPTGGGKTVIAAHLMDRCAKKGKRPMFVAPAIALVEQTLHSFEAQGIRDIGIIQANHARTDWRAQVQIASRDTLMRRQLPEVDFVIIDEAHAQREALNELIDGDVWKDKIVIGLSATPWSKGLGLHWTKLIVGATMADMIADGYPTGLVPFKVFSSPNDPDMSRVKTVAGDFQESGSAAVMGEARLIGDAVETWLKHRQNGNHPGDRTFLYGVNRAHAKALMEAFNAQGISCGYIDGESQSEERVKTFKRYRTAEDKILANVGVLITGVDEDVRCLIDCAPTKSEIQHVQRWGRGARLADGKNYCLGLDHASNCTRIGLPWDIHHEQMDNRKPTDKGEAYAQDPEPPKPRKCKKCFAIIPPKTKSCPACGDTFVKENDVFHEVGELVEFNPFSLSPKKPKKAKNTEASPGEKSAFYSQLLGYAEIHGKSEKWALANFREKFKSWPYASKTAKPSPPRIEVERYLQSRRIAWAKSQRKDRISG